MANTHTWVITELECYPSKNGLDNVVFNIHWKRYASDTSGRKADCYGSQAVELNKNSAFTAYEELTFAQVCAWLEDAIGPAAVVDMDAALDAQLAKQIAPLVVSLPLPWA